MSGLNEIIQWVEDEVDLDPNQSSEQNFNDINEMFHDDHRSNLSDILGDDKGKFLEFIEDETKQSPEDIEIASLESRFAELTREIEALSQPLFNILGTPIR